MDQRDTAYYDHTLRTLEDPYVAADERGDVAGGSGSGGGLDRWERKRRVIATAFDHHGVWLDIGCANGLLMETMWTWTAAKGVRIEPHGLELSERIAARARLRLPHWAARIWTGNVMTWTPPRRFDYVTLLPEFVPEDRLIAMLTRVRDLFLEPGGRLVVSCYRPGDQAPVAPDASTLMRESGFAPSGSAEVRYENGALWTSVAWSDVTFRPFGS
jgi:hypothetical protein